jgi:hypothetical protein
MRVTAAAPDLPRRGEGPAQARVGCSHRREGGAERAHRRGPAGEGNTAGSALFTEIAEADDNGVVFCSSYHLNAGDPDKDA